MILRTVAGSLLGKQVERKVVGFPIVVVTSMTAGESEVNGEPRAAGLTLDSTRMSFPYVLVLTTV